uniref:Putative secreted protein ovary overexpressed n=1 Tax=Rhipicephalus microplus TaxID=6941 RepID=A0A6M2DBM4_RHIMP
MFCFFFFFFSWGPSTQKLWSVCTIVCLSALTGVLCKTWMFRAYQRCTHQLLTSTPTLACTRQCRNKPDSCCQ